MWWDEGDEDDDVKERLVKLRAVYVCDQCNLLTRGKRRRGIWYKDSNRKKQNWSDAIQCVLVFVAVNSSWFCVAGEVKSAESATLRCD